MSNRYFALLRALFFAALFVSLWTWFIPRWIAASQRVTLAVEWRGLALPLLVAGAAIMCKCVFDFAWSGRGTPAPWDPPRRLVVTGLYRYVRNPMYVGMILFLTGEALVLPPITRELLLVVAGFWAAVMLFILLHEEPALRAQFGEDYRLYCANVRRWIPRLTPFDNRSIRGVPSPDLE